jgi:hypothetical protein
MKVKWKNNQKLKPSIILKKIDNIKFFSDEGKLQYSGMEYMDALAALHSMIYFPEEFSVITREKIISTAIDKMAKNQTLNIDEVIDEINSLVQSTLVTKEKKYHLLTSISFSKPCIEKNINIENCRIRIIENNYPQKYATRNNVIERHKIKCGKVPENYTNVIVDLKSKSPVEAAQKALKILDIQRAIWCLWGNSVGEIWGKEWEPINKIRLGNIHTLHEDNGKILKNIVWYEPNFKKAQLYKPSNSKVCIKYCKQSLEQLNISQYNNKIKEALLRFVRALDERDPNVALIRLWSGIETLAAPHENNYDLVTRRCAFLFKEYDYHKQILEHLREYRNCNIHAGNEHTGAKSNCYQLQTYFRELVIFHLRHAGYFSSLEEANSFLDLPNDVNILEKKKKLLEKAIQFRTG